MTRVSIIHHLENSILTTNHSLQIVVARIYFTYGQQITKFILLALNTDLCSSKTIFSLPIDLRIGKKPFLQLLNPSPLQRTYPDQMKQQLVL